MLLETIPLSPEANTCGPMALVPAPVQSSATVTPSQLGPLSPSSVCSDVARLVTFAECTQPQNRHPGQTQNIPAPRASAEVTVCLCSNVLEWRYLSLELAEV